MARNKINEWLDEDGVKKIRGWVGEGLTDKQIAGNMGVSVATLKRYKTNYPDIADAFDADVLNVDDEVEAALLKKALGGVVTAQIYWLKNRRPEKWRDKRDGDPVKPDTVKIILERRNGEKDIDA